MANVFRTFIVPAALAPQAVAITDALGYPHKGMFTVPVTNVAVISTGIVDSESPLLGTAEQLWAAVQAGEPGAVTLADCQAFIASQDLTAAEPFGRMDFIEAEVASTTNAPAWVQPQGAHDAYAVDAAVTYAGKGWRNLTPANVFAPGVSGWRELWGSSGAPNEWPDWVQPTGAHDAYKLGAKVSYAGKHWLNTGSDANVWAPGVFGWTEQP